MTENMTRNLADDAAVIMTINLAASLKPVSVCLFEATLHFAPTIAWGGLMLERRLYQNNHSAQVAGTS